MKASKKAALAALTAVVTASLLAGCGGGDKKAAPADAKEIKIGASFELTGNVANYGRSCLEGLKLAVSETNKAGGINGKQIVIVESDNKSEPSESGNSVTKLITKDKVVAIVGPAVSGCVAAATPIVTANKIPLMAPAATAPGITEENGKAREFIFRACFTDPYQGAVMAKFAGEDLKAKSAAILQDSSSDYSKGLADVFQKTLEKSGGKVVAKESFLAKDVDFKAALTKLKASKPDVIYVPGYYEEVAKIIKQAREIGIDCPMLGSDGWDSPKLVDIGGAEATNKCYFSSAFTAEDKDPGIQKFIEAFKVANSGKTPDIFNFEGYVAGTVLLNAIKVSGGEDGTKIADALAKTKDLPVANGKFTYDDKHNPVTSALIMELKDGKQILNKKLSL